MSDKNVISVVVTVYNVKNYIGQCLNSIIDQTYHYLEIIIIDDGSDDGSSDICDEYAKQDDRIRVHHIANSGVVRARKIGAHEASGEYISIIDGDDWLEPDMLEKLVNYLNKYGADVSMCGRYEDSVSSSKGVPQGIADGFYDKNALKEDVYPRMIVKDEFFEWGIFPSLWDKLVKREKLLLYLDAVDETLPMGNDAACVYPFLLHADSIYITDECLYHYRQSDSSMVRIIPDRNRYREGFIRLFRSVYEVFEKGKEIYDLREQWLQYMIFLMIPRADVLYKGIEERKELFPFPGVKKGSRVIMYGMGLYGQRMYDYLKKSRFCEVVMAVDQRGDTKPEQIEALSEDDYDAIIIPLSFANTQRVVYDYLRKICPEEKIHCPDLNYAMKKENLIAFGLDYGKEY